MVRLMGMFPLNDGAFLFHEFRDTEERSGIFSVQIQLTWSSIPGDDVVCGGLFPLLSRDGGTTNSDFQGNMS